MYKITYYKTGDMGKLCVIKRETIVEARLLVEALKKIPNIVNVRIQDEDEY